MEHKEQLQKMTQTPVGRLIMGMSVPTIISMMVTSVYNMADTIFVSKLGTSASGAVGIVFPIMTIIQAVGYTFGMGSGSWISRLLGAGEKEKSNEVAATGFYTAFVLGILIAVLGIWRLEDLIGWLGASETILPFAADYARYILMAAPVMASSFVLNNLLRSEGHAGFAMVGITAGGILNLGLDPLLIFVFDMGISGAAVATAISQCISFLILLSCFLLKKTTIRLGIHRISRNAGTYLQIMKNGLPSFTRQGLSSVASILLNKQAVFYGDAAVAAMAIVSKIFMMIFSVLVGFGQGYQPVAGFNYGAGEYGRVKQAMKFTTIVGMIGMSAAGTVLFLIAPWLMKLFISDDPAVWEIGTMGLRAQALSMPLIPIGTVANMTFQSVGESLKATIMSAMRQGIFFLPLVFLLPALFDLLGVTAVQAASDCLTAFACAPFLVKYYKNLASGTESQS